MVPNRGFHDPRTFHDPIHDLEALVTEGVVPVDEPVQERSDRDWFVGREVENRAVVLSAGDLEIHGEDEGFEGLAERVGFAE